MSVAWSHGDKYNNINGLFKVKRLAEICLSHRPNTVVINVVLVLLFVSGHLGYE